MARASANSVSECRFCEFRPFSAIAENQCPYVCVYVYCHCVCMFVFVCVCVCCVGVSGCDYDVMCDV